MNMLEVDSFQSLDIEGKEIVIATVVYFSIFVSFLKILGM